MVPRDYGSAPIRRFFLARSPGEGETPELLPSEAEHARRVLRLRAGDRLIGLDGAGGAWPLEVQWVRKGGLELARTGPVVRDPQPGEESASLPWIEVAVPLPRGARAEEMLDRLTQLGAAVVHPLVPERAGHDARRAGDARRTRLERIALAACKQSGRTWPVEIAVEKTPEALLGQRDESELVLLDPEADVSLIHWLRARSGVDAMQRGLRPTTWTRARPLVIAAGPEGGFSHAERSAFLARGAMPLRIHPHVLRIETAVEAALAIVVAQCGDREQGD